MPFEIKRGDLEPALNATLTQDNGMPIDLSTAVSVRALVRHAHSATTVVDRTVPVVSATGGTVRIVWVDGETDNAGLHEVEFEIMWPASRPRTAPSKGAFSFTINPDLGGTG